LFQVLGSEGKAPGKCCREGLAIGLHNSVQANKSHGSSHIFTLLRSAVGWEMILDCLISVKKVFQVKGEKNEKVKFPSSLKS